MTRGLDKPGSIGGICNNSETQVTGHRCYGAWGCHGVVMGLSWACFYITRGKMFTAQQAAVPELMQLLSAYQCMISWYELSIPTSGCN